MGVRKVRAAVTLSVDLLEAVDAAIREGKVDSREEFFDTALRNELSTRRRASINAAFAQMATDHSYQREALDVSEEFEVADWEALRLTEGGS